VYPPQIASKMAIIYSLIGFKQYIIIDKIMYRLPYITKSKSCQFQYRNKRKINRTIKQGIEGYYLIRNSKRKFYSLKKLKHKLIK
jgi:hypothetical protein